MPLFFYGLVEAVETIRDSHPDAENYGLQKILTLLKVRNQVEKRKALTDHVLLKDFFTMVHGDSKKANENLSRYRRTLNKYQK